MANYKRRFTKDEFKHELMTHLHDMPKGHFQNRKHLEKNAALKAEHYSRALAALDSVADRLRKIAETHPDPTEQQSARSGLTEISDAIDAYGEASMSGNSNWHSD